ncbi:MAG: hypothetical protein QOE25_957, partial [Actinomycetota bacterium]|nr:hypothetical protein [Actinomycetota bacterium]
LVRQIEGLRPERQREVAVAAAVFSLALNGLTVAVFDPQVAGEERRARRRGLDAEALRRDAAASDYRDARPEDRAGYLERLAKVRAVRAAAFALDDDPLTAALEACYEVLTATKRGEFEGASALRIAIGGVAGPEMPSAFPLP